MDLEKLKNHKEALGRLIEADNEISDSQLVREQALEALSSGELSSLEVGLEKRGIDIIDYLLASEPDDETFHEVEVDSETEKSQSRCFADRTNHTTTTTTTRDITVPGLGDITVSRIHKKYQEKYGNGRENTEARSNTYEHSVIYKRPDSELSMMVTAVAYGEDESCRWKVDKIASFETDDVTGRGHPQTFAIAQMSESVDSLENIADAVHVKIPDVTLTRR